MMFNSAFVLALATLLGCAGSTPVGLNQNSSLILEERDNPLTDASLLDDLRFYAQHASAAYCNADPSQVKAPIVCANDGCARLMENQVQNVAYLGYKQSEVEGYIGIDSVRKEIVVSFKGSQNIENYIADALFEKVACDELYPGCEVHKGFKYAWDDVTSPTISALQQLTAANPTYRVVFVGHSLGGSVAIIAAAYFRAARHPCVVYTYGSPRVGNEIFADFIDGQAGGVYRVTHESDPAPRYPGLLYGFHQTGTEFWLHGKGATDVDYELTDIQVCPGTSNTDCNGGQHSWSFQPHSYYFQKIGGCS